MSSIKFIKGILFDEYLPGANQASFIAYFSSITNEINTSSQFKKIINDVEVLSNQRKPKLVKPSNDFNHPIIDVIELASGILSASNMPLFDPVICQYTNKNSQLVARFPTINGDQISTKLAIQHAISIYEIIRQNNYSEDQISSSINKTVKQIRKYAPKGINTLRFLKTANELGVPWARIYGNVFQFGWGANATWLDSTLTTNTSAISVNLAKDKYATASILRSAGIPVPQHIIVTTLDEAIKASSIIQFPVVIKPLKLDGGIGVMANLKNIDQLLLAFNQAKKFSKELLVEKHIEGQDYRIQILNGQAYWAIERIPGGVIGNGSSTIEELLIQTNAERKPGGKDHILHPISLDEEAMSLLHELNLKPTSIPENDVFIRLRRSSNVANGGTPIPCLEKVHLDNLDLAIRAAAALKLDAAGIDMLIPNISNSWKESTMGICEVNAQPQLSGFMAPWFLKKHIKNNGRVPVIFIIDNSVNKNLLKLVEEKAIKHGIVGVVAFNEIRKNLKKINSTTGSLSSDCKVLKNDPEIEIIIGNIDGKSQYSSFPFDQIDLLILDHSESNLDLEQTIKRFERLSNIATTTVIRRQEILENKDIQFNQLNQYHIFNYDQILSKIDELLFKE